MLATALSATLIGLDAYPVRVEVDARRGPPFFELVGLAEASVRESRVRVRSALKQIGIDLGECIVTVNLAPADLKKTGSGFDLAIAVASLAAMGVVPCESLENAIFLGELSLTGTVQPLRGILAHLLGARARGVKRAVVPGRNASEAALVDGIDVRLVDELADLVAALRGGELPRPSKAIKSDCEDYVLDDVGDIRGQSAARRALEVAAAGGHNVLMIGPPGAGKTMLARRLPGLLPELSSTEALEVSAIHSIAGLLGSACGLPTLRPFRSPHHTVSEISLVGGGGTLARPGEVTLAHHGVLFLDEVAEFRRGALEALRQPLEDGVVSISRVRTKITFPARPLLVCAMNPCPCGYLGDGTSRCGCTSERVRQYRGRLSGPLMDRIDVHVALPPVTVGELQKRSSSERSRDVRARVVAARAIQQKRKSNGDVVGYPNVALSMRDLERVCSLCPTGSRLLSAAVLQLGLSARAYGKILRTGRTIADLDGSDKIRPPHIAEAIGFRVLDRANVAAA